MARCGWLPINDSENNESQRRKYCGGKRSMACGWLAAAGAMVRKCGVILARKARLCQRINRRRQMAEMAAVRGEKHQSSKKMA